MLNRLNMHDRLQRKAFSRSDNSDWAKCHTGTLDALLLTRNQLSYRAGGSKRWVWMLPRPNMLVFWMITRLILDLRISFKDWISSCFPLNSRNSPRRYLFPFSSNLHGVRKPLYFLSRWRISNIRTGNILPNLAVKTEQLCLDQYHQNFQKWFSMQLQDNFSNNIYAAISIHLCYNYCHSFVFSSL